MRGLGLLSVLINVLRGLGLLSVTWGNYVSVHDFKLKYFKKYIISKKIEPIKVVAYHPRKILYFIMDSKIFNHKITRSKIAKVYPISVWQPLLKNHTKKSINFEHSKEKL